MADRAPRQQRVLLTTLSVRTSGRGTSYLSGYLGKAKVVAFAGEPDRWGNPTWDIYLAPQEPRPEEGTQHSRSPQDRGGQSRWPIGGDAGQRRTPSSTPAQADHEMDDAIPF